LLVEVAILMSVTRASNYLVELGAVLVVERSVVAEYLVVVVVVVADVAKRPSALTAAVVSAA